MDDSPPFQIVIAIDVEQPDGTETPRASDMDSSVLRVDGGQGPQNGDNTTQSVTLPREAAERLVEHYPAALNVSEALRMAAQEAICEG